MSRPVDEREVSSTDPSNSDHISTASASNNHRRSRPEDSATSHRSRVFTASDSPVTDRPTRSRDYPLHEFRSLLEAAQRIADSAPFVTDGDRWREDDQPEPIIHLNRRRTGDLPPRRVPLTREYSGRPHVPGEDSGSETSMDVDEMDLELNDGPEREDMNDSDNSTSDPMQGLTEISQDQWFLDRAGGTTDTAARIRARADHIRPRSGRQEEEERELLEQALARSRQVRSRFEADNQRPTWAGTPGSHYATTGPSPTRDSFYDWAPEPSASADLTPNTTLSRSRAASIRRWRPAERLQDYASNHARRDSVNVTQTLTPSTIETTPIVAAATTVTPATIATPATDLVEGDSTSRTPAAGLGSHDDVVDRVERALQQYRLARRALRAQTHDPISRIPTSSENAQAALERALSNRASFASLEPPDAVSAARTAADDSDTTYVPESNRRTAAAVFGQADTINGSTAMRSPGAGRDGRQDPLRQRIREQVRERRRHVLQSWSQDNTRESLARGPLFESTIASQNIRLQADPRRALEKIRLDESRARSAELKRAKAALQYLARLRDHDMNRVNAWTVASELGLHDQSLEEDPNTTLPMSVESLPALSFSSWLEPGMTWTGIQDANDAGDKPTRPVHETLLDTSLAREQRERVDLASRQYESFRSRMGSARDPLERALLGDGNADPLRVARNSMQVLEDAERSLSSMLERSEELLRENERQLRDNEEQLRQNRERLRNTDRRLTLLDEAVRQRARLRAARSAPILPSSSAESDWWDVKVTLHSVDQKQMTVSGTMTASHRTAQTASTASDTFGATNDQADSAGTGMDSFFTGDVVDFRHHGLDTLPSLNNFEVPSSNTSFQHQRQQDEWQVGGPETDLCYWAGIGPFKYEVERALKVKETQNDVARATPNDEKQHRQNVDIEGHTTAVGLDAGPSEDNMDKLLSTPSSQDTSSMSVPLSEDEKFAIKMDTMARLLCDTTWLSENIGVKGWILMRWKERCFVAPGTDPNPDARRPWIPNQSRTVEEGNPWYLHDPNTSDRLRRRGERDTRVWSTNAEEREEFINPQGSTNTRQGTTDTGARQPTWGLTISGFYYVALERKTGHIEALYYDCGSTPFQRLKMTPMTLYGSTITNSATQSTPSQGQDTKMTIDTDDVHGDFTYNKPDLSGITGLKTNFNIIEFR